MPRARGISPANTTFVVLCFEGPDRYSVAGGLGIRVTELSRALAEAGYRTHLLFVGDPEAPPTEAALRGRLRLRRWCQWISAYYPRGVYEGEEAKLYDFNESVPPSVVDAIARPWLRPGRRLVVLAEEWHTAEALCRVSDALHAVGLRRQALLLWNANNTTSFDRIDWGRLGYVATLTTVSRYMKHLMWGRGVNPLVVPNGIPARLLEPIDARVVGRLRASLGRRTALLKIGRWHPDKRWLGAVETVARLKALGERPVLIALGGAEPHESEVLARAQALGLSTQTVRVPEPSLEAYAEAFAASGSAEVLDLKSFVPLPLLRPLYRACTAVLADSGHEPFGLVGLEAMACGALVFTGGTGEDYAAHLENAIVLETADPAEAVWHLRRLRAQPAEVARLGRAARATARRFAWPRVVERLVGALEFLAARQDASGGEAA